MNIPVYLFTGFLESGKTKFIQETLEDKRFHKNEKTLVLVCEEGVEEFEPSCRFGGCSHIAEPDCGVKAALEAGELSNVRYDNYRIIYKDLKNARPDYSKKKNSEK